MRATLQALWALGGLAVAHGAQAQDAEPGPDLDFLEYLGTWQAEDDEWLAIEEWDRDNDGENPRADGAQPRSPERRRNDDDEND